MSNQLDDRIRDLYAELVEAAPALPPLPAAVRAKRPWERPWVAVAAAAAATIVILGAVPTLLGGGLLGVPEEAADTTSVAAAETTAPDVTVAPGTTAVGEVSTEALNTACHDFSVLVGTEFPTDLTTLTEYRQVWDGVALFSVTIDSLGGGVFLAELTALDTALAGATEDDLSQASLRFDAVVIALDDLTRSLVVFGATDCVISGVLPPPTP